MKRSALFLLSLALVAPAASAQSFGVFGGLHNVNPESDNGTLAGGAFETSIDSDTAFTGGFEYYVDDRWSTQLWAGLQQFEHEVSLNGAGAVDIKHRPIMLSVQYRFANDGPVTPFVGLGYHWTSVRDERSKGPLLGADVDVDSDSGFAALGGVDWAFAENWYLRGDVRYLDWTSDVEVAGLGNVGQADVNPFVYGISVGYRY